MTSVEGPSEARNRLSSKPKPPPAQCQRGEKETPAPERRLLCPQRMGIWKTTSQRGPGVPYGRVSIAPPFSDAEIGLQGIRYKDVAGCQKVVSIRTL